jgi:ATPase subunit of ABC transporter with duplicated ATPase domains
MRNQERQLETQEKQKAHMQQFIDKFRASASRGKMVQSRIKAMSKMATLDEISKVSSQLMNSRDLNADSNNTNKNCSSFFFFFFF